MTIQKSQLGRTTEAADQIDLDSSKAKGARLGLYARDFFLEHL
jgi:hypothetical protein